MLERMQFFVSCMIGKRSCALGLLTIPPLAGHLN